jgi:hypothetical protein
MTDFSVVDETFDYSITSSYFLSIRVSPDGFSFCTLDPVRNKYIQLQYISLNTRIPVEQQIESHLEKIEKLNLPYKKTLILISTRISTLVPTALYENNDTKEMLQFCHKIPENSIVFANKVKMADAYNIFAVPEGIHCLFTRQFQEPKFYQQHTAIIESNLATTSKESDSTILFINLENNYFDLLAFTKNNLQLCNSFPINSENDFIYFALFVFEQLKLKPATSQIIVSGNHPGFGKMILHLNKYVRNVKTTTLPHHFQYSHQFKDVSGHEFHNLLTLPICVS